MEKTQIAPDELFKAIWKMKVHFLRAKFYKWRNQRVYFVAEDDSFPWKVLEYALKDPAHLPQDVIIVNAIYTGQIWRNPGTWGRTRATIMEFRDIIFEWVSREGKVCQMTPFNDNRKKNKKRGFVFKMEEVLAGGLSLKKMRAGFNVLDRSLAGAPSAEEECANGVTPSRCGMVPCSKRTPAPRSSLSLELEKWEKNQKRRK